MNASPRFASSHPLAGKRISIIPFPALGDVTVYLRMAQSLASVGAKVFFYSDLLASSDDLFDWLAISPIAGCKINDCANNSELLIVDVLSPFFLAFAKDTQAPLVPLPKNLLAVTAKQFPQPYLSLPPPAILEDIAQGSTHGPFCPGRRKGPSMIDWVDDYTKRVFGIDAPPTPPAICLSLPEGSDPHRKNLVLIFPTTPNPSKNYRLDGFVKIADAIANIGWNSEFICMPHEYDGISAAVKRHTVRSFQSIRELILHMAASKVVVSNDSGGGHLGAMLGLKTITITKKAEDFVWRPGFPGRRHVISPTMTIKWFTGRIWRPFINTGRVVDIIGTPSAETI